MGLFAKDKDFFGLDIGSTGIRVVKLSGVGSSRRLERYNSISVDTKLSQSQAPADRHKLAQIIKKLVADTEIRSRNVVIGVPSKNVYASVIETAKLTPQELKKSINYLAEQYVPVALDQVKLDWAQLGASPDDPNKQEVLLLAARNSFTEARLGMLEAIGLDVIGIQPDALAMARALVSGNLSEPVMILDLGATSSDILIAYNNAPRLIRSIPVGGEIFIRSIIQALGVDSEQASQFLFKFGLDETKLEGKIARAVQPNLQILVEEIKKSIKFFTGRYKGQSINKIIITGQASNIPELPVFVVNESQIAVEIGNSWTNVNYSDSQKEELMGISTQFSVAVGLAESNL